MNSENYSILSVDPGYTNVGSCLLHVAVEGDFVNVTIPPSSAKVLSLRVGESILTNRASTPELHSGVERWICDLGVKKRELDGGVVLMEEQFLTLKGPAVFPSHKLKILEALLYSALSDTFACPIHLLASATIKREYDLSNGDRGKNKKAAVEYVKNLLEPEEAKRLTSHHVCDTILQAKWWLSKRYPRKIINLLYR